MRGVTQRVNDSTGLPVSANAPLVRARGAEVGMRTRPVSGWQTALTVWALDMDSELEFDADTGDMQPEGATRRIGFESANDLSPYPWLNIDCDFALSRARFRAPAAGAGAYVPEAIEGVGSLGVALKSGQGHSLNLRLRYFGPRALVQDDSVRSASSTVLQAGCGYQATPRLRLQLEAMNLLNAKVNDIEYYYTTRLQGEPAAGVTDRLVHPADPRSLRFAASYRF
jgi:outer membrane receptor protein involved in Fe transport